MNNSKQAINIGILQCDEVMEKLQPQFGGYGDMIQQMFADIAGPLQFDVFDCRKKEYPENIERYSFFVTTGSRHSVYDKEPWIQVLIDFVKELDRRQVKLIGICFGHQIIAMARHGKVEKSGKGWGVGVAVNRVTTAPAWMHKNRENLNILVSHQDQVTSLPKGALVIAESDFCPNFIVQWSNHFFSIQGHPEWNKEYARALMHERRAIIPSERLEGGLSSLDNEIDNEAFVGWIIDFVSNQ